jgi:hypothetical protein
MTMRLLAVENGNSCYAAFLLFAQRFFIAAEILARAAAKDALRV